MFYFYKCSKGTPFLISELQKLREDALFFHNRFRILHNAPEVKLDSHMNAEAEDWANILASRGRLERNPSTEEGENVFYQCGKMENPARDAVLSWYVPWVFEAYFNGFLLKLSIKCSFKASKTTSFHDYGFFFCLCVFSHKFSCKKFPIHFKLFLIIRLFCLLYFNLTSPLTSEILSKYFIDRAIYSFHFFCILNSLIFLSKH